MSAHSAPLAWSRSARYCSVQRGPQRNHTDYVALAREQGGAVND